MIFLLGGCKHFHFLELQKKDFPLSLRQSFDIDIIDVSRGRPSRANASYFKVLTG